MKIFLAGDNLFPLYVAPKIIKKENNENIYGGRPSVEKRGGYDSIIYEFAPYVLESFWYVDDNSERLMKYYGDYMLDSGAYSFMVNSAVCEWEEYLERYCDFIKQNNVEKFFELDIDNIVGYDKVLEYRKKIEKITGRQCIPVWHTSRGYAEYERMCDEYKYIGIGGIVAKEIKRNHYHIFPKLINEAHKRGAKVHGLGFTNLSGITKYHFDSVDSTAWTTGNRFGYVYKFNGKSVEQVKPPRGYKLGNTKEVALRNYTEWIKFQKYAETNL